MIELNLSSDIFNTTYIPYNSSQIRNQIFFGGASAGKSVWAIGQRMIIDLMKNGRNYLCIRNVGNTLRTSIYNEAVKGIHRLQVDKLFTMNKSEMTITCKNGYQAILKGLDDVQKIKSITPQRGVITDLLIEEAIEISKDDLKELKRRLRGRTSIKKRIVMLFNPMFKTHWIYEEYFKDKFGDDDTKYEDAQLLILKTTYKDNKFLSPDDIYELEEEKDQYYYDVYTLGKWGILGKLIFKNWKIEDLSAMKKDFNNIRNGLDFGYSNDPVAFSRSHFEPEHKKIYVFSDQPYVKELTNPDIAEQIKPTVQNEMVYCDSSEPKSIKELRDNGIRAYPCIKGKDSLLFSIRWLQQYEIIIDKNCQNAINEMNIYQWKKLKNEDDKPKPIDRKNHFISALRYSYSRDMFDESKAYFYTELNNIRGQSRIKNIPIESGNSVYTFWKFTEDESVAIWFVQLSEREVKIINCYSNSDLPFVHYVNYIKDWRDEHLVTFEKHIFPHDAKDKVRGTEKSMYQIAQEYKLKCGFARKPASEQSGIELMRQFFSRCWFDTGNCTEGLEALTLFRKSYDSINDIGGSKPVQDWTIKYIGAFLTMALYLQKDPEKEDYARVLTLDGRTGGQYKNPGNAWMR